MQSGELRRRGEKGGFRMDRHERVTITLDVGAVNTILDAIEIFLDALIGRPPGRAADVPGEPAGADLRLVAHAPLAEALEHLRSARR
jgi:hypothetical protein